MHDFSFICFDKLVKILLDQPENNIFILADGFC